jgi:hypothetical protein
VGGLVGRNEGGNIADEAVNGNIVAGYGAVNIGGLVGYNYGIISGSISKINITIGGDRYETRYQNIGGLIGENNGGTVNQSSSSGRVNVSGASSNVQNQYFDSVSIGGLVGQLSSNGQVVSSRAEGEITALNAIQSTGFSTAAENIGGLVGLNNSVIYKDFVGQTFFVTAGAIQESSSSGNVFANNAQSVGVLVGKNLDGTISKSTSLGDITSSYSTSVGGLVGVNQNGILVNNNALGNIYTSAGDSQIGALIGANYRISYSGTYYDPLYDNVDLVFPVSSVIEGNVASGVLKGSVSPKLIGFCDQSAESCVPVESVRMVNVSGNSSELPFTGATLSNTFNATLGNGTLQGANSNSARLFFPEGQAIVNIQGLAKGVGQSNKDTVYDDDLYGAELSLLSGDVNNYLVTYTNGSLTIKATQAANTGTGTSNNSSGNFTSVSGLGILPNESAATASLISAALGVSTSGVTETVSKVLEIVAANGGSFQQVINQKATEAVLAIQTPSVTSSAPASTGPSAAPAVSGVGSSPASGSKPTASSDSQAAPLASPTQQASPTAQPAPATPASTPSASAAATVPAASAAAGQAGSSAAPPPVAPPPPSPIAAEKPPTPKDSADAGDKSLAAAAPPPPPKPASQARAPAIQVVAVSPVVSTQVPLPPRPPAGAAADQRVPVAGNSAKW